MHNLRWFMKFIGRNHRPKLYSIQWLSAASRYWFEIALSEGARELSNSSLCYSRENENGKGTMSLFPVSCPKIYNNDSLCFDSEHGKIFSLSYSGGEFIILISCRRQRDFFAAKPFGLSLDVVAGWRSWKFSKNFRVTFADSVFFAISGTFQLISESINQVSRMVFPSHSWRRCSAYSHKSLDWMEYDGIGDRFCFMNLVCWVDVWLIFFIPL
jgi:hypothetical protein